MAISQYVALGRSAYRNRGSTDYLSNASVFSSLAAATVCGWAVKLAAGLGTYEWVCAITGAGPNYMMLGFGAGTGSVFEIYNDSATEVTFGTNYGQDQPFFWAMTNAGAGAGNFNAYARRPFDKSFQTINAAGVGFTPTNFALGQNQIDGEWMNGRIWNVRCWNRVLTARELMIESLNSTPQSLSNLRSWYALEGDTNQLIFENSGSGLHLTPHGSPRNEPFFLPAVPRLRMAVAGVRASTAGGSPSSIVDEDGMWFMVQRERVAQKLAA